jgi:hypothetical protein
MKFYNCDVCGASEATIPDEQTQPLCDDCYSVSEVDNEQ